MENTIGRAESGSFRKNRPLSKLSPEERGEVVNYRPRRSPNVLKSLSNYLSEIPGIDQIKVLTDPNTGEICIDFLANSDERALEALLQEWPLYGLVSFRFFNSKSDN